MLSLAGGGLVIVLDLSSGASCSGLVGCSLGGLLVTRLTYVGLLNGQAWCIFRACNRVPHRPNPQLASDEPENGFDDPRVCGEEWHGETVGG